MAAPLGYAPYNSYPHLRLGSKGDFVAWAQQLLAGAGYSTPISGYYRSVTQSAVYSYQAAHGLPQSGSLDVPTWDLLLKENPLPVHWTKGGAVAASKDDGHLVLPPPVGESRPAVRDEIPSEEPRLGSEALEDGPVGGDLEHGRHHRDPVFPRELGASLRPGSIPARAPSSGAPPSRGTRSRAGA